MEYRKRGRKRDAELYQIGEIDRKEEYRKHGRGGGWDYRKRGKKRDQGRKRGLGRKRKAESGKKREMKGRATQSALRRPRTVRTRIRWYEVKLSGPGPDLGLKSRWPGPGPSRDDRAALRSHGMARPRAAAQRRRSDSDWRTPRAGAVAFAGLGSVVRWARRLGSVVHWAGTRRTAW